MLPIDHDDAAFINPDSKLGGNLAASGVVGAAKLLLFETADTERGK